MEGTSVRVAAVLARVVRSFAGSRVERELLAQAFALIRPVRPSRTARKSIEIGTPSETTGRSSSRGKGR